MGYIDWTGYDEKIQSIKNSKEFRNEMDKGASAEYTAKMLNDAAAMLEKCIRSAIEAAGFSSDRLIQDISHSEPKQSKDVWTICVSVDGQHRDSMYPEGYPEGCYDIAVLLDTGYSADRAVFELNKDGSSGNTIKRFSLPTRAGLHYFEQARDEFISRFKNVYNIVDVRMSMDLKDMN